MISGAVGQVGEQSGNTARWAVRGAGFPEMTGGRYGLQVMFEAGGNATITERLDRR